MLSAITTLIGGVGLFLLGMWLMTEGLKLASGEALRRILESGTRTAIRGFAAGFGITALIQSSSTTTVATVGFVNAGLLRLSQAIWVMIGANVGTTMTGWIVALGGFKLDVGALAMPLVGIGMLTALLGSNGARLTGLGQAVAGFGVFFLGIDALQLGFLALSPYVHQIDLETTGPAAITVFLVLGVGLTVMTQSSSAALAIILTASASGEVPLHLAAVTVVGANIGTTSTAVFAALSATPAAKRVAAAHVLFNVITATAALVSLAILLHVSQRLASVLNLQGDLPATLAIFHTLFNLMGAVLIAPFVRRLTMRLSTLFVTPAELIAVPQYLDKTLVNVPDLALRALARELRRMASLVFQLRRDVLDQKVSNADVRCQIERDGLLLLGQECRKYADRISTGGPPESVARGLQDLIRATQHLSDLLALSPRLWSSGYQPLEAGSAEWAALRDAAVTSLSLWSKSEHEISAPEIFEDQLQLIDERYQGVKGELLRAASVGIMTVVRADEALTEAQTIRRIAATALKAQRRLSVAIHASRES